MKKRQFEGSAADNRKDKAQAAKRGMSVKQFEGSPADERMDRAGQRDLGKKGKGKR